MVNNEVFVKVVLIFSIGERMPRNVRWDDSPPDKDTFLFDFIHKKAGRNANGFFFTSN